MFFCLLLADSEGEKRMLPGQIDEADILVGGESRRQGRMVMLKMQCTAKPVAPCCDGRCTAVRHLPQDTAVWQGVGRHIIAEPFQASPCRLQTK